MVSCALGMALTEFVTLQNGPRWQILGEESVVATEPGPQRMTSELCVMNRYAAVLAADSAITVRHWDSNEAKAVPRYFKGANKIFQLSANQPVGVMIYATAGLHGIPWEVLIKDFRLAQKDRLYEHLEDYATALFDFIRAEATRFPAGHLEQEFIEIARRVALVVCVRLRDDDAVKDAKSVGGANLESAYRDALSRQTTEILNDPLPTHFTDHDVNAAVAAHRTVVAEGFKDRVVDFLTESKLGPEEIADVAIQWIFRLCRKGIVYDSSGIVVAGFGDKDFFPVYREYMCCGFVLDKLVVWEESKGEISFDNAAEVKAFAVTGMVDTFEMGFSSDVLGNVRKSTSDALIDLAARVLKEAGVPPVSNLEQHISEVSAKYEEQWIRAAFEQHRWPLHRVIGSLPVGEMADLAETLIMLQSLKEKVTQPSESVGGPVDVAVITKGDGFVWVKRKHYFDPKLNPRYFQRQRALYDD